MSLDLYLACPHCRHAAHADLNITHNVRGICIAAGCDPWEWQGRTAAETLPELRVALAFLADPTNIAIVKPLEPDNGWGTVGGTQRFLNEVRRVAEGVPEYDGDAPADVSAHRWRVSR